MKAVPVKIDLVQAGLVFPENNPVSVLVSCSVLFTPPWLCAVWVVCVPHALNSIHDRHRMNSRQIFFFIFIRIISSAKVVTMDCVYFPDCLHCICLRILFGGLRAHNTDRKTFIVHFKREKMRSGGDRNAIHEEKECGL